MWRAQAADLGPVRHGDILAADRVAGSEGRPAGGYLAMAA